MTTNSPSLWVVLPAAGVGKRMKVNHPKQYLKIQKKTVIELSISRFLSHSKVAGIVVVISKGDEYWEDVKQNFERNGIKLHIAEGGKERCHSVLNGLRYLKNIANEMDWVMVHDAARPCLHKDDIQQLIDKLWFHSTGGLLGLPVADTLKFSGDNMRVKKTVDRSGLWRALTPQMFRYQKLLDSLESVIHQPEKITDEASAMELSGYEPVMVEGRWDNIKITHPQDLTQAKIILEAQKS